MSFFRSMTQCVSILLFMLMAANKVVAHHWNTSAGLLPWEAQLQLGHIQRPLGLTLNYSSLAHHHFIIGYISLHSFMYQQAHDAFDLALNITPTLVEAHLAKMFACKQPLWSQTDYHCGLSAYNATLSMLNRSNMTLTPLQSALLSTVYLWYANESSTEADERGFLLSISDLSKKYANESDVMVWWGLSLLNVAYHREFDGEMEPKVMVEGREILKRALAQEPNHPGALHYLIHAYDVAHVETTEKAADYAILYGQTVLSLSHAQHMPAHVWMRTGAWPSAMEADGSAIRVSFVLCASKILNRSVSFNSTQMQKVLSKFNTTSDLLSFHECDAENRAHSMEWLAYSRLQTGDWFGSLALLRDLFTAENQSLLTPNHYLPFAYRTHARTAVELFFWFPYSDEFLNKMDQLNKVHTGQPFALVAENATGWYPVWSEAGYRYADCLHLLTNLENGRNSSTVLSTLDEHLSRLVVLSNQTKSMSKYISTSILMMAPQILGMRYYINDSWQECLNELYTAVQLEATLVADGNSPTLVFARSKELLATHLLLIYNQYQDQPRWSNSTMYWVNNTWLSIEKFPSFALDLYKQADREAPNRAINTLGMARTNAHSKKHRNAITLYQQLFFQITSSNQTDESFLTEINEYLDQHNSAIRQHFSLSLVLYLFVYFMF